MAALPAALVSTSGSSSSRGRMSQLQRMKLGGAAEDPCLSGEMSTISTLPMRRNPYAQTAQTPDTNDSLHSGSREGNGTSTAAITVMSAPKARLHYQAPSREVSEMESLQAINDSAVGPPNTTDAGHVDPVLATA